MIDVITKVKLGNLYQKIHIKSKNENNPVLLFLHGGPGVCNRHTIMTDHLDLLDTFTMVSWDQRGSGGSYFGCERGELTVDRMALDTKELIEWLCDYFRKDKIFIIGGSWGSELGIVTACRYPEHIAAFVGFGQVVNGEENEKLSWEFCMEEAKKARDTKSIAKLLKVGPPVLGCYKGGYNGMMVQRNIMMKYGGYSPDEKKKGYASSTVIPMIKSREYTVSDLWGLIKGHKIVLNTMWAEVGITDFNRTCTNFKVPVFIFDGKLDRNTPSMLVQPWFDKIEAPRKELIWFEKSGHNPMNDEPFKFKTLLREKLLEVKNDENCTI